MLTHCFMIFPFEDYHIWSTSYQRRESIGTRAECLPDDIWKSWCLQTNLSVMYMSCSGMRGKWWRLLWHLL